MQENHSHSTRVALHVLILGSGSYVKTDNMVPDNLPNLLTETFSQTPHRNLLTINLHAWLQQSRNNASMRQWQYELRLLKESQSMKQSGPFLQSGATVISWSSGHHLSIQ